MRELGYVEGRNINFEWRYADAQFSRAMQFAAELVRLPVAVIVAYHTPAVRAAMNATKSIPIVMSPAGAPLELGFINSLARPGGNVTGLSAMEAELGGKRLGLLQEMIPGLTRVAVLAAKTDPFSAPFVKDFQSAGVALNVQVRPALVDGPAEFKAAFANMVDANDQAAIISPTFLPHSAVIVALANLHRIPTISSYRVTTQAGGLLSYSADHAAYYRRAGVYVDSCSKAQSRPSCQLSSQLNSSWLST
jgi:putative ABC transport system substrate-binding protein